MKSWDNITLGALIKVTSLSTAEMDSTDKQVAVLSVLTGKPEEDIWELPKDQFLKLSAKYQLVSDLPKERKVAKFKAGGYTWTPQTNVSKFSLAQYVDLSEYVKDPVNNAVKILATISEPKRLWFKPTLTFEQKVEAIAKAKASDAFSLSLFFCRVLIHLTNSTKGSLEKKMKETIQSQTPGGGT